MCVHDRFGADIAACARPIVDNERLAKPLRQPLAYQPCEDVAAAAWSEGYDQSYRSRRIGLRPCRRWESGCDGSRCCHAQKFSARKFYLDPFLPRHSSVRDGRPEVFRFT